MLISNSIQHREFYRTLDPCFWNCVDWIFPPTCGGCGKPGYQWCPECQDGIKPIPVPICDICGAHQEWAGICPLCHVHPPPYQALRSLSVYEGSIRHALHELKYRNNISLGAALSKQLTTYVRELSWTVDTVVPVPLGKIRRKERGYNPVELIAAPLANAISSEYNPKALCRIRDTETQVGLSPRERMRNMQGAFIGKRSSLARKKILLVDDVTTTGATITSCARALKKAGVDRVYAVTVARAVFQK